MAENLNCSSQKANSEEYNEGYDKINWESEKK